VVHWSDVLFEGAMRWEGQGVEPHGLQYILTNKTTTNTGVPRGTQSLDQPMPHVASQFDQFSANKCLPHHLYHVSVQSYDPTTSACTDCTVSVLFFLFDILNRLQYLLLSTYVSDEMICVGLTTMRPTLSSGLK
jgi:hypothetical protein